MPAMSVEIWLLYTVAAIGLSLTPGPNGLLALTHGMRYGLRPTVFTVAGGVCGFMLVIAVSMAGMGALLAASEQAFTIAKWIGGAYLVYLGIKTWRAPAPQVKNESSAGSEPGVSSWQTSGQLMSQGFFVAASNPKALIFFAAFLPQFIDTAAPQLPQFLILGGTFGVIEFIYELVLAGTAGRLAPWLGRKGRLFNKAAGATFVGIGGLLATVQR